jgi:hypothetical protein
MKTRIPRAVIQIGKKQFPEESRNRLEMILVLKRIPVTVASS